MIHRADINIWKRNSTNQTAGYIYLGIISDKSIVIEFKFCTDKSIVIELF